MFNEIKKEIQIMNGNGMSELSKNRIFLSFLLEDLETAYQGYCILNGPGFQNIVKEAKIETIINSVFKKNITISLMIALCKIYEKPSDKNIDNMNIYRFLNALKELPTSDYEDLNFSKDELSKKVDDIQEKIGEFNEVRNALYLFRNKAFAHLDMALFLNKKTNIKDEEIALDELDKRQFEKFKKKINSIESKMPALADFTLKTIEELLSLTDDGRLGVKLGQNSPNSISKKVIEEIQNISAFFK